MSSTTRLQDLPPEGGYNPFNYKRVPLKPLFNLKFMVGTYLSVSAAAWYIYYLTYREITREEIEMRSGNMVIYPLLIAERDREYLKQVRRNRDEEAELMKNVPGWVVGTWYGEPIYKTLPKAKWVDPSIYEFYGHTSSGEFSKRVMFKHWY